MDDDALARVAGKRRREEASSESGRMIPPTMLSIRLLRHPPAAVLQDALKIYRRLQGLLARLHRREVVRALVDAVVVVLGLGLCKRAVAPPVCGLRRFRHALRFRRAPVPPPAAPVVVPDPSLSFIPLLQQCRRKRIAASTGGLLCLHLTRAATRTSSTTSSTPLRSRASSFPTAGTAATRSGWPSTPPTRRTGTALFARMDETPVRPTVASGLL